MLLDVDYILLGLPGVLVSSWAWWKSCSARRRAVREGASPGPAGEQAARLVLRAGGIEDVPIEAAAGPLANHYEAGRRRLCLSREVLDGRSPIAVATAIHEAGHALQEAGRSPWTPIRKALVPAAELGSILSWILFLAGVILGTFRLTVWGLAAFSSTVLLQLLNLGAEVDASRRAVRALGETGDLSFEEREAMAAALGAAEWSHVAAVLTGFPAFLSRGARRSRAADGVDPAVRHLSTLVPPTGRD